MTVRDIVEALQLEVLGGDQGLDREVTGGYASDLLSDVIANSRAGDLWVSLQAHRNIIAVASLKELAGVVLVGGRAPDSETLAKAREEQVLLLGSRLPAFEVVGRLYALGLRGAG
ncbi:MAG: serine kinase [Acidobacteriota bacterium]